MKTYWQIFKLSCAEVFYLCCFKVAVFAGGVDTSATETKGTVLMHTAEQVCQN